MITAELRLPADATYVGMARLLASVAARREGLVDERVADVKVAVDEATATALRGEPSQTLVLRFARRNGGFEVTVETDDAGNLAHKLAADTPRNGQQSTEGALSLVLIRGLADEVLIDPSNAPSSVTLRFGKATIAGYPGSEPSVSEKRER